jgi:hypothetical protein
VVHQVARVFAPASVIGTCPAPSTQLGSSITLAGALKESPTGAHMAAAAQTQIGMVATLTNGSLSVPLTATTDPGGHYAFSFDPPEAGAWTMQVVWTGDHSHAAAYGQQCAMLVTEPPPVPAPTQTALTATCKAGTAGSPDDIGGALTPAVGGAQIKLSYERDGAPTDTITDNVTTAADGTYTDHPVPDAAGTWDVTASYGGDTVHQPSVSTPCQFTVAPQQTTLALTCPGKSSLNKALGISGTITPAIAGASIKLTYTHQTQGPLETFTATPTVDSTGAFSDASVTPNDPGAWKVNATYAGDNVHAPATATPCTVQIS